MIDMLGNNLESGDLVAYAARSGNTSVQCLAIIVNTEKKSILSATPGWGNNKELRVGSRPGYGVIEEKLLKLEHGYSKERHLLMIAAKKYMGIDF